MALVMPAFIYLNIMEISNKFAAIYIAALTLPWSFLVGFVFSMFDISLGESTMVRNIVLIIFVIVNNYLIYRLRLMFKR